MTNPDSRARRAIIQLGNIEIEGFQLSGGGYRLSQAGAAAAISETAMSASRFLSSKAPKALLGEGFADHTPEQIEVEPDAGQRGTTRINALSLDTVTGYWLFRAYKGNRQAAALTWALLSESLERRFDDAFGVERSETERNQRLTERLAQVETQAADAFAEADIATSREKLLEQQLRDAGIEPWQLPLDSETDAPA